MPGRKRRAECSSGGWVRPWEPAKEVPGHGRSSSRGEAEKRGSRKNSQFLELGSKHLMAAEAEGTWVGGQAGCGSQWHQNGFLEGGVSLCSERREGCALHLALGAHVRPPRPARRPSPEDSGILPLLELFSIVMREPRVR